MNLRTNIKKEAIATVWGGVSILNAIPTGVGCAFGIDIPVRVRTILTDHCIKKKFTPLISACIESFCGGSELTRNIDVEIDSPIPPAMGLKSSSAVSNGTCMSLNAIVGGGKDKMGCVIAGVEASLKSGVSITGGFDDACASMFGRAYLTDNNKRRIIAEYQLPEWCVIIFIPEGAEPRVKSSIDCEPFRRMRNKYMEGVRLAKRGELARAMNINGMLTARIMGDDVDIIKKVIELGALAGGTTGTGPALAFIFDKGDNALVRASRFLRKKGDVIHTTPARQEGFVDVV